LKEVLMSNLGFSRLGAPRNSARRRLLVVVLGAAAVLTPRPATAQEPGSQVTPITVDAVVTSCGFAVGIHLETTERALDFGERLGLTYSDATATLTNLDSGTSLRLAVPGPEFVRFDGGTVTVSGPGPWLWFQRHPVTLEEGIWLTRGLVVRTFEDFVPISVEQHGTTRDLCDELT
jgi:hypothetical protein